MRKKLLSLFLAVVLCLGLAVPAGASASYHLEVNDGVALMTGAGLFPHIDGIEREWSYSFMATGVTEMNYQTIDGEGVPVLWLDDGATVHFTVPGESIYVTFYPEMDENGVVLDEDGNMNYINVPSYDVINYVLEDGEYLSDGGGMIYLDDLDPNALPETVEYTLEMDELFWDGMDTEIVHLSFGCADLYYGYRPSGESGPAEPETPTEPAAPEAPSAWAVEGVNAAIAAGIVPEALQGGYTAPITRAEFCALAAALYESRLGEITERTAFSDTSDVNVEKIAALGVILGMGDGTFDPGSQLTREQAATILARLAGAMGKPLPEAEAAFSDMDSVSGWAQAAVGQAVAGGIMNGMGDNLFQPKGDYTREQSILTMNRLLEYLG